MLECNTFAFNDYDKKPLIKGCLEVMKSLYDVKVWTLDDLLFYIEKLPYTKHIYDYCCKGVNWWSLLGDELRLYLASLSDDFIYFDADCIIENLQDLKMDHVPLDGNEGSYFRGNKNTPWIKSYLEHYSKERLALTNYQFRNKYHIERPTQDLSFIHFWNH